MCLRVSDVRRANGPSWRYAKLIPTGKVQVVEPQSRTRVDEGYGTGPAIGGLALLLRIWVGPFSTRC